MKRQSGWCDVTFLVTSDNVKYIFKVFIDTFTATVEQIGIDSSSSFFYSLLNFTNFFPLIEAEIAMIEHLQKHGLVVPKILPTKSGTFYGEDDFGDEERGKHKKRFRLQTFIEGNILDRNLFPEVCSEIGDLAGRVDKALESFSCKFFETSQPNFVMEFSDEVYIPELVPLLPDGPNKALAVKYVDFYNENIKPKLADLPQQQIHCDMHGSNIIIDAKTSQVVGLIDFSDSRKTIRVMEPAITLGSILMFATEPLESSMRYLSQYCNHVTMTQLEKESLPVPHFCFVFLLPIFKYINLMLAYFQMIIAGRMLQAIVMHEYFKANVPGYNADYLGNIYGNSWNVIRTLMDDTSDERHFFYAIL